MNTDKSAFSQASQVWGVQIQQRIIVFYSRAPQGLEQAEQDILRTLGDKYQKALWIVQELGEYLASMK
jgi:hypothetical protein